jgi:Ran GTPase-activating protein (RanGAP) involved in mRNA processing and transport
MSLWLSNTSLMTPSVPQFLEEICQRLVDDADQSLTMVDLTHPRLDDNSAKVFAKALGENTTVTTLVLSCFCFVDDGAAAVGSVLGNSKYIQRLQLRELRNQREVVTLFRSLLQNTSVQELSLRHSQICRRGAEAISYFFQTHPNLEEVRFVDCQFIDDSLRQICQGLKSNRSLQRLYLVNTEAGVQGAEHIADLLEESSSLRELYLCENELGDEGVTIICRGVLASTSLRLIDLRSNGITAAAALSIQGVVARSQFLLSLGLGNNELGNNGAAAIARGLQGLNCVVQKLDLSENKIEKAGGRAIASILHLNKSLNDLNLSFNPIGDEGAGFIASALRRNLTLCRLVLRRCNMTNEGATLFARSLPLMGGLRELLLNKNNIDSVGSAALIKALRANVEIEYLQVEERMSQEIFHWIRLNKAGRRLFRHPNVPSQLWPPVFARISSDPDVLFHFLKEKPEVVGACTC